MAIDDVPSALHARLGTAATSGLLQLLEDSHREEREDVITACPDRFERRVVEQASALRVEIAQVGATLRQEMMAMEGRLRSEIASGRVEFIRWSFMFWIGQVLATVGIMSIVVRVLR